jgi:PAS domain S-box-containing protein
MGNRLVPVRLLYSDPFTAGGESLIGSFKNSSPPTSAQGRDWLLGIFRSRAGLHTAAAARFSLFGTLIAVCGLAMPISLLLMYYTHHLAQRDQTLAEQARARLAAVVQDSEDAIFTETFDGVITSWNRGAERLFGYSETEALGRKSADIIACERSAEERQAIEQLVDGERADEGAFETIRGCKDGRSSTCCKRSLRLTTTAESESAFRLSRGTSRSAKTWNGRSSKVPAASNSASDANCTTAWARN